MKPTLELREWTRADPTHPVLGPMLSGKRLTETDRRLLLSLSERCSLRVEERRDGLRVQIGPHVGAVSLNELQILVLPKLPIEKLARLIAYAFRLSDLAMAHSTTALKLDDFGMVDLLAWSLLRAVERVIRAGLLPEYVSETAELASPKGRIDMRALASRPPGVTARCRFEVLTLDHPLNRTLADGLRWTSGLVHDRRLKLDLRRAADRALGHAEPAPLTSLRLRRAVAALDRRSSHYRPAMELLTLLFHGHESGPHLETGRHAIGGFFLDMNVLFERFLTRYLQEHAPAGIEVVGQQARAEVFTYLENPSGWRQPQIRPDLIFKRDGEIVLVADVKYRNRHEHPPSTAELYQLTAYGLSFEMRSTRRVVIFHPLGAGEEDRPAVIRFSPDDHQTRVEIHLCGVPLNALLGEEPVGWWPLPGVFGA